MKQINESQKKTTIILEEGEVLEIKTCREESEKVAVKCLNATLFIEELLTEDVRNMCNEKKAIQSLEKYLDEKAKEE